MTSTLNIGAGPNIIANREQNGDDRFTLPVGLGVNTTVNFDKLPVRIGAEAFYSVIQPDDIPGNDWSFRFYVIPAKAGIQNVRYLSNLDSGSLSASGEGVRS